jgi:thymidylate synthase (FAD)
VSFARRKEVVDLEDENLIRFLMVNRHGTPFEHNAFRFHVKAPIFVAREWFRHRIGSFNEWSLRYSKVEEADFYMPEEFRTQVGKPGAYTFETWQGNAKQTKAILMRHYQDCLDLYHHMEGAGIARELARLALPFGMYTEFYWTVNARSLMNFLSLRNAPAAQQEIQSYAKVVEEIFGIEMPWTRDTFVENGRIQP